MGDWDDGGDEVGEEWCFVGSGHVMSRQCSGQNSRILS